MKIVIEIPDKELVPILAEAMRMWNERRTSPVPYVPYVPPPTMAPGIPNPCDPPWTVTCDDQMNDERNNQPQIVT